MENVVDIARNRRVIRIIIRAVQHHAAILQHLQQLVHLHRMQFADFIQKQHPAMRFGDRAGFGLRHALCAQLPRTLINRVMDAADERVGNRAFIKAHARRIHLDERRILAEGRPLRLLRRLQHQPRRAGLADAGRAVNQHMLRIRAAENRLQAANAVLLTNHVAHFRRAHLFRQRL